MKPTRRTPAILIGIGIALAFLALSLILSYEAGCIGDVKGGALGDPVRALDFETSAIGVGWCSVAVLAVTVGNVSRRKVAAQAFIAFIAGAVAFAAISYLGVTLETVGIQSCLMHG